MMKEKTFKIVTLGCKVNQYESAYLREKLMEQGWTMREKGEEAQLTIINTCIVTGTASQQSRQAIRKAIRENPKGTTLAVGCYAQVFPQEISKIEGIGAVVGNRDKIRLPRIIEENIDRQSVAINTCDFDKKASFEFMPVKEFFGRTRAFLKIQDGCESYCSYCIVPFSRGPFRSLSPDNVIETLWSFNDQGYKEVVLTGIHLGKYGIDQGDDRDLRGLLKLIGNEKIPLRIRLSSLEPGEIDETLIELMASEEWLCRHLHIPLQSGDDRILDRMNRHYTRADFEELVRRIHDRVPLAAIGVDVMAGFPGEDEQAYNNTYYLINDLPISYLHVFPFSPREGTVAAGLPDKVSREIIRKRAQKLRELGKEKRIAFYNSCLRNVFPVLTQGWYSEEEKLIKGISDNFLPVIYSSPKPDKNRILNIRIEEVMEDHVRGKPV